MWKGTLGNQSYIYNYVLILLCNNSLSVVDITILLTQLT